MPFPILTTLVVLPLVGAFAVLLVPNRRADLARVVGPLFSIATGALSIYLLTQYDKDSPTTLQFVTNHEWIPSLGISWHLGVDGISVLLVVLAGVMFPVSLVAVDPEEKDKTYFAWFLLLEAAVMGTFLALDMFLFFVCFEISLVPLYFLIAGWGHGDKVRSAIKFFLYTSIGSVFMLVAMVSTAVLYQKDNGGPLTFDLITIASGNSFSQTTARWLFAGFAIAFSVKAALFPVHTWLPDAHGNAPTAGSVQLAALMLKLGTYGFIRFGIFLFPAAAVWFGPFFVTIGVIGIVYGAICAAMQRDLKRVIAFSSVSHLGFIVLGTFALTTQSLTGGILQMVNHGVSSGALFLLVGYLYQRRHTYEIKALRGLQRPAPDLRRHLHPRHALVDRGTRAEQLRRRVPRPHRLLPHLPLVGRGGGIRRHPRRGLHAVVVPAGLPRRAGHRQRTHGRPQPQRAFGDARPRGSHRLHRGVPEAAPRAHRAFGQRAHRPRRASQRLPPTSAWLDRGGRAMNVLAQATATFSGPSVDWWALSPLIVLVGGGLALLVVSALTPRWPRGAYAAATVAIAMAAMIISIVLWFQVQDDGGRSLVGRALRLDGFSLFLTIVICITVVLTALAADDYLRRRDMDGSEVYGLFLMAAVGAIVMASATDLIVLFLGLETLSISLYVMAGSDLKRLESQESALKYFILGSFSSAFFLYGIALVYGATGTTNLDGIFQYLSTTVLLDDKLLLAGLALLLVGLGFKAAAVPFQWWTPDVYQGAPTPVTGFFASAAKAAAFAALLRVFVEAFTTYQNDWQPALTAIAVATLLVGAVVAIVQTDVKRMMAYSSISHAGFILVGVEVGTLAGISASLLYLFAYSVMVIGTFAIIAVVSEGAGGDESFAAFRGLGSRRPLLAAMFTLLLLAQAGVPFTSGFIAKFGVITAAAQASDYVLAVAAMAAAVIAMFLYFRVVVSMYTTEAPASSRRGPHPVGSRAGHRRRGSVHPGRGRSPELPRRLRPRRRARRGALSRGRSLGGHPV